MNNKEFNELLKESKNKKTLCFLRTPYENAVFSFKIDTLNAYLTALVMIGRGYERLNNCSMSDFVDGEYFTVPPSLKAELRGVEEKIRNKLRSMKEIKLVVNNATDIQE